jgi:hypothetical protein
MKKLTAVVSLAGACALWPLQANAQEKGPVGKGTFVLSAERLTGVFHSDESIDNPDRSIGRTTIALFGMGRTAPLVPGMGIMEVPRIGFDGFVINGLSIGGTLALFNSSYDDGSETDFLLAPRVGYAYMFSSVIGIWPRGGFSYWHASFSPNQGRADMTANAFAFNIDCPLLIFPSSVFAITLGPLLDLSFAGTERIRAGNGVVDEKHDFSATSFGLSAGVAAFF